MHESERDAAISRMIDAEPAEGYVVGEIDDKDIRRLKEDGLIVQVLEEEPVIETQGLAARRVSRVPAGVPSGARLRTAATGEAPRAERAERAEPRFYIVSLKGPL